LVLSRRARHDENNATRMKQNGIVTNNLLLFPFNGKIINKVILYLGFHPLHVRGQGCHGAAAVHRGEPITTSWASQRWHAATWRPAEPIWARGCTAVGAGPARAWPGRMPTAAPAMQGAEGCWARVRAPDTVGGS
jgi:hypothetical protein